MYLVIGLRTYLTMTLKLNDSYFIELHVLLLSLKQITLQGKPMERELMFNNENIHSLYSICFKTKNRTLISFSFNQFLF